MSPITIVAATFDTVFWHDLDTVAHVSSTKSALIFFITVLMAASVAFSFSMPSVFRVVLSLVYAKVNMFSLGS